MRSTPILALLLLGACKKEQPPPPKLMDTGWFSTDTVVDPDRCAHKVAARVPEDGETDVYWRDRPQIYVSEPDPTAYEAWLVRADDGSTVPTSAEWSHDGLSVTLVPDDFLQASTDYELWARDCAGVTTSSFRTGPLGAPMEQAPSQLVGNTYLLDLVGAEWVEPPALAGLIAVYFNNPILLGIQYADPLRIDLIGAPGVSDAFGVVEQDPVSASWDFPIADFSSSPFLDASSDEVTLQYSLGYGDAITIPVEDFVLQATFSPDATRLGGGVLSGLGDTRNLGELLGDPDNPAALCELAGGLGVTCQPCADGQSFCLRLVARDLEGTLIPGLELVEN